MAAKGKGAAAVITYDVLSPVQDGEFLYAEGDTIDLVESEAKDLILAGVLKKPKPATAPVAEE